MGLSWIASLDFWVWFTVLALFYVWFTDYGGNGQVDPMPTMAAGWNNFGSTWFCYGCQLGGASIILDVLQWSIPASHTTGRWGREATSATRQFFVSRRMQTFLDRIRCCSRSMTICVRWHLQDFHCRENVFQSPVCIIWELTDKHRAGTFVLPFRAKFRWYRFWEICSPKVNRYILALLIWLHSWMSQLQSSNQTSPMMTSSANVRMHSTRYVNSKRTTVFRFSSFRHQFHMDWTVRAAGGVWAWLLRGPCFRPKRRE